MNITVIYSSRTGITSEYAGAITAYMKQKGHTVDLFPVEEYDSEKLKNAELVFLGGWTSGLFLFAQHPDKKWYNFVNSMPDLEGKTVILFTTYKLLTGSMFNRMTARIRGKANVYPILMKSRNAKLTYENKRLLDELLDNKN